MSGRSEEQKSRSPLDAITQWYRERIKKSDDAELKCLGDAVVERMANDMGISANELHELARMGPGAAELLRRRLAALDLDPGEVGRLEPSTLHDMQRVCTMCEHHRRCARDLAGDPANPAWKDYCPNATTLEALNAEPWPARREW
jgi:hypothetical protein